MWQSLEHVHAPLETLREAHRLLVPGGKLVVAVPNIDSLPFCWFGASWIGLDLPRHLTHFSPWTLSSMLERAGFRVTSVESPRHSEWLRASAQRSCRRPRAPRWHRWLRTKMAARLAAGYTSLVQRTDCLLAIAEK
jgi:SAM-dependent methyltransferase